MGMSHDSSMRTMHGTMHRDCWSSSEHKVYTDPDRVPSTGSEARSDSRLDRRFVLETSLKYGKGYVNRGEDDGSDFNPTLRVKHGEVVQIRLVNTMNLPHDFAITDINRQTDMLERAGQQTIFTFRADRRVTFEYYCTVPGHRRAGMRGKFVVE